MRKDGKTDHGFPGIYDKEQLRSGIVLDIAAQPTTHVYHLENLMVPAVVVNVRVKNTAGHLIPHG